MPRPSPLVVAALVALPAPAVAQGPGATRDSVSPAVAIRAERPPLIDGREDDPVWQKAPARSDFLEFTPHEGGVPRFRTEFRVAYDDRTLYVFIRAFDPHPDSIMTALTRRDVRGPSDQLKVMIDSYHDRRSGFEFAVNPVGVKRDYAMYNDKDEDESWDGVWDVATRIDSAGWTAEFAIPFSQLRYATSAEHVFGFAIWRDIERYKERTSWPLYRSSQSGISSQLGVLEGIRGIAPFERHELIPYVVARTSTSPYTAAPAGTAPWRQSQRVSAGADLKFGLTPNVTLDATVNPDFGQVEADPSVLNLSAFETFFEERRPFFVEGAGTYQFTQNYTRVNRSSEGLFYSRRIGRTPQLLGLYGDAASPNVTPILGAAKVTGRLGNGLNVGVLEAVTGREQGTDDRTTEPLTSYSVVRGQQEFRQGATTLGLIATGVNRALDRWTEDYLRRDAYVVGTDLVHRWGASRYEVNAKVTASTVHGTPTSMLFTQLSPVHLYQRPDGPMRLDSSRTSLAGDAEEFNVAKFGGNMVHWLTGYERQSPGYEINDLGYLRRANRQTWKNWLGVVFQKPTPVYRVYQANFNFQEYWTADGLRMDRMLNTNQSMQLANNMFLFGGLTYFQLPGSFCDNCARGGPAIRVSPAVEWNVGWEGDDRRAVLPQLMYDHASGDGGRSSNWTLSPSIEFRLLPQLQFTLGADISHNEDNGQWIGNFADSTGSMHYAFAHLSQETRDATVRASYAVTPTLSLQLYAAPFVSRGYFTDIRELSVTPRAAAYGARYQPYTPPAGADAGFDVIDLRSNSVLRWEFRPGSTMYLVWTHGRSFEDAYQNRSWRDEYDALESLHPMNTFLVKLAYWMD